LLPSATSLHHSLDIISKLNDSVGTTHVDSRSKVIRVVLLTPDSFEYTVMRASIPFSPFIIDVVSLDELDGAGSGQRE
jgi:hypothetical protein